MFSRISSKIWCGSELFSFGVPIRMILETSHTSPFSQDKLCDVDHNHAAESRTGNYTLTIGLYSQTQQPHHKIHSESPEAFRPWLTRSKSHTQSLQVNFEQKLTLQVFVLTFQPHGQARIKLKLQLSSCWITPCPFQQTFTQRISHWGFLSRKVLWVL